jgi:hypothetical protein
MINATTTADDRPRFFKETIFGGSVSMIGVVFGLEAAEKV